MSIFEQLTNSIQYQIHSMTYNPDAEAYAKQQSDISKKAADTAATQAASTKAAADKAAAVKVAQDKQAQIDNENAYRKSFHFTRLFGTVFNSLLTILLIFVLLFGAVLGASLSSNLNLYRPMLFRILYAFYGFLFFYIVIPYVLGYRWFWKGKRPRFYSLIPIVPYHLDNRWTAFLFSWLSYKPDDQVEALKEWMEERAKG